MKFIDARLRSVIPESFRELMQFYMKSRPEKSDIHIYFAKRYLFVALGDDKFVGNELFQEIKAEVDVIENDEDKLARISGYAFFLYIRELERLGSQIEADTELLPKYIGLSDEEPYADYLKPGDISVVHNGFVHLQEAAKARCEIAISHFQQFYPGSYKKFENEKPSLASKVL